MTVKLVAAVWLASMASCLDKNAVYWAPYNGDDDVIAVDVGVAEEDDRTSDLHSNTGLTSVGDATISPGAGPVGTEHTVMVLLDEEFSDDVGRVSVEGGISTRRNRPRIGSRLRTAWHVGSARDLTWGG